MYYVILERFRAMASSTAFSCFRSSSLLAAVFFTGGLAAEVDLVVSGGGGVSAVLFLPAATELLLGSSGTPAAADPGVFRVNLICCFCPESFKASMALILVDWAIRRSSICIFLGLGGGVGSRLLEDELKLVSELSLLDPLESDDEERDDLDCRTFPAKRPGPAAEPELALGLRAPPGDGGLALRDPAAARLSGSGDAAARDPLTLGSGPGRRCSRRAWPGLPLPPAPPPPPAPAPPRPAPVRLRDGGGWGGEREREREPEAERDLERDRERDLEPERE